MIKIDVAEANKIVVKANKVKIDRNILSAQWTKEALGRVNGVMKFSRGSKYDDFCGGREFLLGRTRELVACSSKFTNAERKFLMEKWGTCTRIHHDHYRKRLLA